MSTKRHDNVTLKEARRLGYTGPKQPGWKYTQDVNGVWYCTLDASKAFNDYAAEVARSRGEAI